MTSLPDPTVQGNTIYIGDTEPTNPVTDDLWFDTTLPGWKTWDGAAWQPGVSVAAAVWGAITGTLSDQTDLQTALDLKANSAALGTAAAQDVGVAIDDVVQMVDIGGAVSGLPAINGSLLTNLPVQFSVSTDYTITGNWDFSNVVDLAGYIEAGDVDSIQTGSTLTFKLEGSVHEQTLTGNVDTWALTLPTAPKCGSAVIILEQATGPFTVTYPGTWKWANGTEVDIGVADGDILELVFHSTPSGDTFVTGNSFAVA